MIYLRPKKRLGQHFLRDRRIINRIIARAPFSPEDTVVEVGPGTGAVTIPLSRKVKRIYAIEKDRELVSILKEKLNKLSINNVFLICGNVLSMNITRFRPLDSPIQIIGNLPFNISSPFLERLTKNSTFFGKAVLMFQEEFAKRLLASPCSKAYGAISVWIQYHATIRPLLSVPPKAYYPVPKVGGMVLELDFQRPYSRRTSDDNVMRRVIKAAFSHRRKTILNSINASMPDIGIDNLRILLKNCEIEPDKRAEQLSIDDYICLTSGIMKYRSIL